MCLAVPGQVVERNGDHANIDFGGVFRKVNVCLVDAKVDDFVLVHAGFAIQIIEEDEAKQIVELWHEMLEEEGNA